MTFLPSNDAWTFIYSRQIIEEMERCGVDTDSLLYSIGQLPGVNVLSYPDMSIQIQGNPAIEEFERLAGEVVRNRDIQLLMNEDNYTKAKSLIGSALYTSLQDYHNPMMYYYHDWGEHIKNWEESGVIISTKRRFPDPPEEWPINDMLVSVAFKRRLSKAKRQQFCLDMAAWHESVKDQGMFDDGPILWPNQEIEFFKRLARFWIDASRSGQNTINWLILNLMHHAVENPITDICFTKQPYRQTSYEECFGLSDNDLIVLPLPEVDVNNLWPARSSSSQQSNAPVIPPADTDRESHVPDDAEILPGFDSDHFKVLFREPCLAESLLLTIYFEQVPNKAQAKAFEKSIASWVDIGMSGGFGNSFHYTGDLELLPETDSAQVFCDMGEADVKLAITILTNILVYWSDEGGILIEALVVGGEMPHE